MATFDWTVWFLVQGPVDNFTQNWTGETLVFLSGIHNKLFNKGGFRVRTKIVLVFGQVFTPDAAGGVQCSLILPSQLGRGYCLAILLPHSKHLVSQCRVQFFKCHHLATLTTSVTTCRHRGPIVPLFINAIGPHQFLAQSVLPSASSRRRWQKRTTRYRLLTSV